MELAFDTPMLRKLCESEKIAKQDLGPEVAEQLKRRIADLRAADTVMDLVASPPSVLDDPHQVAIALCDGWRLVCAVNHTKVPAVSQFEKVTDLPCLTGQG